MKTSVTSVAPRQNFFKMNNLGKIPGLDFPLEKEILYLKVYKAITLTDFPFFSLVRCNIY